MRSYLSQSEPGLWTYNLVTVLNPSDLERVIRSQAPR